MSSQVKRYAYFIDAYRIYQTISTALRREFWQIFILQTTVAILESSTIIVITGFIASVSAPERLRQGRILSAILEKLPEYYVMRLQGDRTLACAMCVMVVLFIIAKNLLTGFTMSRTTYFAEKLGLYISKETYSRYLSKNYRWHISPDSANILFRLGNKVQLTSMATAILQFFGYLICSLCMMLSLFLFEPRLTLILVLVFSSVGLGTYCCIRRKIDRAGLALEKSVAKENEAVAMVTRGIREIIIYRKQRTFLDTIVRTVKEQMPHKAFLAFAGMLPAWFLEVAGFATVLGVMVYLAASGLPMHEIVTIISMLFLSAWRLLPAISRSMGLAVQIRGLRPMALTCLELLEGFGQESYEEVAESDSVFLFKRRIELDVVRFGYSHEILHSISLGVDKGDCLGIIGISGSGKSTLAMILAGLLVPESGAVSVDGVPLGDGNRPGYRDLVGFVPQNPLLLPGTIADNVALRRWGEEYDRSEVIKACRMAAMDFIGEDASGIDYHIDAGGQGLSGGQAQKVSIARALFGNPEVVIFDEATSSLDQASENIIADTIQALNGKVTMIVVAHRLTSIEKCDSVVWVADGRIIDSGKPSDILPRYLEYMKHMDRDNDFQQVSAG